ncbi:MAG TPA: hypothetical protein VD948_04390 [Rhodothermales bacterium]|nr:hypothetical protein [Rhodothermales bacterium]
MREHHDNVDRLLQTRPEDGAPLRWLKAQARYVRLKLNGRALVTCWLPGGRALAVEQVFALRDECIVLQGRIEGGGELHISLRPDAVLLEMRPAPEGEKCTAFSFLGVSRTPQPFIEQTEQAPTPVEDDGHHH